MTEPRGNGPVGPENDLAALAGLDLALDELAAGGDLPGEAPGGQRALAALAADLRAAMPAPPPGAAERGRAAFLARAGGGRGRVWRRSLPLRLTAVAAALVVLVAVPAAARQARPGTALWPVREVGQQVRVRLAGGPVERARLRLSTAAQFLEAGAGRDEEGRKAMADRAEEKIEEALEVLKDVPGPEAAAARARAGQLLARVDALEHQDDPADRSGSGPGPIDDRSGKGGGDDRSGSGSGSGSGGDRSGRGGGGSGSGSESGSGSGSGSASGSGSGRSGSGDD